MGAKAARLYNYNQAKNLSAGIQRILNRINRKYTPYWMFSELNEANHKAQCIQGEFGRIMRDFGEQIEEQP